MAHRFADPEQLSRISFSRYKSQFNNLSGVLAFAANWAASIVAMLTLLSAVILVVGYLGLVTAQALAVMLLYVFGPMLIALLPSRQLSTVTYGYVEALSSASMASDMEHRVCSVYRCSATSFYRRPGALILSQRSSLFCLRSC